MGDSLGEKVFAFSVAQKGIVGNSPGSILQKTAGTLAFAIKPILR
jgi:hypothetical protein